MSKINTKETVKSLLHGDIVARRFPYLIYTFWKKKKKKKEEDGAAGEGKGLVSVPFFSLH